MRILRLFLFSICILLISACEKEDDHFTCPSCSDSLNFTPSSYGDFVVGKSGSDSTARKLISQCGWNIHEDLNGGVGSTLQIKSCKDGVIFVWAYQSFSGFEVSNGWSGSTERGIDLGTSLVSFLTTYPNYSPYFWQELTYWDSQTRSYACFDETGILQGLSVKHGGARTECPRNLDVQEIDSLPSALNGDLNFPGHTRVYRLENYFRNTTVDIEVSSSVIQSICLEVKDRDGNVIETPIDTGRIVCGRGIVSKQLALEEATFGYSIQISSDLKDAGSFSLAVFESP